MEVSVASLLPGPKLQQVVDIRGTGSVVACIADDLEAAFLVCVARREVEGRQGRGLAKACAVGRSVGAGERGCWVDSTWSRLRPLEEVTRAFPLGSEVRNAGLKLPKLKEKDVLEGRTALCRFEGCCSGDLQMWTLYLNVNGWGAVRWVEINW